MSVLSFSQINWLTVKSVDPIYLIRHVKQIFGKKSGNLQNSIIRGIIQ